METKATQCHPKPVVNATCILGEKGCYGNGKCQYMGNCENKVLTNADRIRAMSDEELAKIINAFTAYFEECNRGLETDCHDCELCELCSLGEGKAIDWLKQPAEEVN